MGAPFGATILDAEGLRLTAQDLHKLGVIDRIIAEPMGGAHRDRTTTIETVGDALRTMLADLGSQKGTKLLADRRKKFLDMGAKGLAA